MNHANAQLAVPLPGRAYFCHVGTTNTSFLTVSRVLADKGVKNNKFMLALFDEGLANVDPHADDLTDELKGRLLAEIVRNPWFFLREVVRVPVTGGTVPYEIHLGNLFLTWCMISNINCYLLLPRQNYKTVSAAAMYLWGYAFAQSNSHILFFNKELKDAQNNLKRLKDLMENLPAWVRDDVLADPVNDRNAIEYVYSAHRNNRIDPKPAGTSKDHADGLGRGNTVPQIWYDEIAFMKFVYEIYMAAVPAQSQARKNAIRMNVPYGTVITTTPNSQDHPSGEFAYMIRNGALHFRLEFYDLGPARVRQMIEEQAEFNFLYAEYQYWEIGRDEKWFREQCRELLNDQVKIKREILLVWPMSTEGSVFTEEQLDCLRLHRKPSIGSLPIRPRVGQVPPGLELEFIEVLNPTVPYLIGIDTASGEGLDYSAFVVSHPDTLSPIAYLRTKTADDDALKAIAAFIFVDLLPRSIAIVERNYLGVVLVRYLLKHPQVGSRVFYLEKEKAAEQTVGGRTVTGSKRRTRVFGIDTTADSREAMLRHLFQVVDELPHLLALGKVQDEIRTLHRKKNGKVEHRSGFHDDVLMAWLMTVYADRHEQPVLRGMLARQRGGRTEAAVRHVASLNSQGDAVSPAMSAHQRLPDLVTVDSYAERETVRVDTPEDAQRRRRMAAMVAMMNAASEMNDVPV